MEFKPTFEIITNQWLPLEFSALSTAASSKGDFSLSSKKDPSKNHVLNGLIGLNYKFHKRTIYVLKMYKSQKPWKQRNCILIENGGRERDDWNKKISAVMLLNGFSDAF